MGTSAEESSALSALTSVSHGTLVAACALFAVQSAIHWLRSLCSAQTSRAVQHEQVAGAATAAAAVLYQGMACGFSARLQEESASPGGHRVFFEFWYIVRALGGGLALLNIATLARDRHPPTTAVICVWLVQTGALFLGSDATGSTRVSFLLSAVALLVPLGGSLLSSMGDRLRQSPLESVYRFLATWFSCCSGGFCLVFFLCEQVDMFDSETEIIAYALLDYCTIGVTSVVLSWVSHDIPVGLLPAQEEELAMYPGPHSHGFYPNPDYYDDNL